LGDERPERGQGKGEGGSSCDEKTIEGGKVPNEKRGKDIKKKLNNTTKKDQHPAKGRGKGRGGRI